MTPVIVILLLLTSLAVAAIVVAVRSKRDAERARPTVPPALVQEKQREEARSKDLLDAQLRTIEQERVVEQSGIIEKQQDRVGPLIEDPEELNRFLKSVGKDMHGDGK